MCNSLSKRRFHPLATAAAAAAAALGLSTAQAANVTWTGPNASFWDLAANWSPGLPGALDDVLLGAFNTTFRSGTVGIRSFVGTGTLSITGGQLSVTDASSITGLTMSNGSLGGAGNITLTGATNITFGDMRGSGTTFLQGATSITSSGLRLDGGRVLRNEATVTWASGQLLFNNTFNGVSGGAGSGTINNIAGATFIASGDGATSIAASNFGGVDTGADAVINNAGTFRKALSGAASITTVDVIFNNTGTVQAQTGVLNLTNGGTHTGNFDVAAGAVLGFGGGTHNINAGAVTSSGTVRVSGSAVVNLNAAYNIAGTTDVQTGFLNLLGGNATTGALTQSTGSVTGSNNFTISGASTITFGDHRGTGTTILQGPTTISSSGFRLDGGRVLRNENTLTWSSGQILFNNTFNGVSGGAGSGTINNISGATFIANGDGATSIAASNFGGVDTGADAAINNAGTFRKAASGVANVTTVDVIFNNSGAVQAQTGVLNLTNGGTHTGNFDVSGGAVLSFGGGTHNINAGTVTSPGTVRVTGSSVVNVNTAYNIAGITEVQTGFLNLLGGNATTGSLIQSQGSVGGSNNLTVTGPSTLTFGDHRGTGTTILQGPTSISSSGFRLDGGRVLRNENTLTWTAGQLLFNNTFNGVSGGAGSGSINNAAGATFIASGDAATSVAASNFGGVDTGADAVINNAGTFRKAASGAASITNIAVPFNNTGSIEVLTGQLQFGNGSRLVHSGAVTIANGAVLDFAAAGGTTHTFNTATTTIGGTLSITGDNILNFSTAHTMGGTGTFQHSFGQVTGANLTLGPTLNAVFTDGAHSGPATTTLQGTASISSTGLRLDGGRVFRNEGSTTQSGNVDMNSRRTGTAEPGNGTVLNASGATWTSNLTGTNFIFASNQGAGDTGAGALFSNAGSFNKTGVGLTDVRTAFNNTGSLSVLGGQLQFSSGGALTQSGALSVAAGAVLDFVSPGAVVHTFNSASTAVAGTLTITGDNILNFTTPHTMTGSGTFQHSFGQVTGANLTLAPTLNAVFTDGAHSGAATTTMQGTATISSTGLRLDGLRIFRNEGATTQAGNVDMNSRRTGTAEPGNGTVVNASGATWNSNTNGTNFIFASNQGAGDTGAGAVFSNLGLFNKLGVGVADVRTAMNNTGTVSVQAGQLQFSSGGALTQSGSLAVAAGAVLDFVSPAGTTHNFNVAGTTVNGTLSITGDNVLNFSLPHTVSGSGTFQHSFGQVTGANLTLAPALNVLISDGAYSGPASTIAQGNTTISGSSLRLDGGRVFRNEGVATQINNVDMNSRRTGLAEPGNGTVLNAAGATWNSNTTGTNFIFTSNQGAGDTGAGAVFTNSGTFNKLGVGTTEVRTGFDNLGVTRVQQGVLQVNTPFDNKGLIDAGAGAVFFGNNNDFSNSGRIEGKGTVRTAFNNDLLNLGVIAPGNSTGTLTLDGALTMGAAGRAQFEITSLADFDKLAVTNAVLLSGTLEVLNLGYTPVIGDSFKIITFNQRLLNSVFSSLTWSGFGPDVIFTATYNPNDVTLNVNAVPEPKSWAMWIAGLAVVGELARRRRRRDR